MARGEVKEAVGQGSSPMREALCLRLKVLCGKQCWQRAASSGVLGLLLIFPHVRGAKLPFLGMWHRGANDRSASDSRCFSRYFHGSAPAWP
jgi:hypothetical protein